MSERSFNRWRKNRAISRPLFNRIRLVLAQNDDLARRFSQLGARDVRSAGGLKIDAPALPVNATARDVLREAIDGRPLLFAASTHDGEERIVIEALALLRRTRPDILAIIAPRHPDRGKDVAAIAAERGYAARLRSSGELPHASTDVYIADTLGELGTLYELCPIAIIGGSLVDKGGQNPIEAVRGGAAVLTGPFVSNFVDPHRELRRAKASIEVADAQAIAAAVENLLADPARLARLRDAGAGALSRLSGALERTTAAVLQLLPPAGGPPSAP